MFIETNQKQKYTIKPCPQYSEKIDVFGFMQGIGRCS
jgi:hypothetical protein